MKKQYLIFAALFALMMAGATMLYNWMEPSTVPVVAPAKAASPAAETTAPAREEQEELPLAPDFTVYDAAGGAVRLSDFLGQPVVLNFWASWCGPCKREMPDFEVQYQSRGDEIAFLMVNLTDGMRETTEGAAAFLEGQGYTFPAYFDTQQEAALLYGIDSIPTTLFIDVDGRLRGWRIGMLSAEELQRGIELITAE